VAIRPDRRETAAARSVPRYRNAGTERRRDEKSASALGALNMTSKPTDSQGSKKQPGVSHPGMMGDGTEEQNLNEKGNPAARIKKDEVDAAFKQGPKK
jgi:hypothetical protein